MCKNSDLPNPLGYTELRHLEARDQDPMWLAWLRAAVNNPSSDEFRQMLLILGSLVAVAIAVL